MNWFFDESTTIFSILTLDEYLLSLLLFLADCQLLTQLGGLTLILGGIVVTGKTSDYLFLQTFVVFAGLL